MTVRETAASVAETLAERTDRIARETRTSILLGMTMMFLVLSMTIGMGGILQGKKEGTWQRLMVSPTSRSAVLGGKLVSQTILAWVQVLVMMAFGSLVFKLQWGAAPLALVITAFILAASGLGLILGGQDAGPAQRGGPDSHHVDVHAGRLLLAGRDDAQGHAGRGPVHPAVVGDDGAPGDHPPRRRSEVLVPVAVLLGFAAVFFALGLWRVAKAEPA